MIGLLHDLAALAEIEPQKPQPTKNWSPRNTQAVNSRSGKSLKRGRATALSSSPPEPAVPTPSLTRRA